MSSPPTTALKATFAKPLPDGVSVKDTAITLLHDHVGMISLNPLVIRHERIEAAAPSLSDKANKEAYIITDKLSYLPFGLWDGEINVYSEFMDTPDGLRTVSRAPLGFESESTWCVRERDGGGGGSVVEERVEGRCPLGLKWFVKGTMGKSHEAALERFVERVKERASSAEA